MTSNLELATYAKLFVITPIHTFMPPLPLAIIPHINTYTKIDLMECYRTLGQFCGEFLDFGQNNVNLPAGFGGDGDKRIREC